MRKIQTDIDLNGNKLLNASLPNAAAGKMVTFNNNGVMVAEDIPTQNVDVSGKADKAIVAPVFSTSSAYAFDDYVIYENNLYRCINTNGHNRLIWNPNNFEPVKVGSELKSIKNSKIPTNHATSSNTYGLGNASNYGHVKLTDNANYQSNASSGVAATPQLVGKTNATVEALKKMIGITSNVYYGVLQTLTVNGLTATLIVDWETPIMSTLSKDDYVIIKFPNGVNQQWQWAELKTDNTHYYTINSTGNESNMSGITSGSEVTYKVTTAVPQANSRGAIKKVSSVSLLTRIEKNTPIGMIVMWSGTTSNVPTGWVLCDGHNGTKITCADGVARDVPDLRERFIVGANPNNTDYQANKKGGSATQKLDLLNLPAHRHTYIGDSYIKKNLANGNMSAPVGLLPLDGREKNGWSADGKGMGGVYLTGQNIYPIHNSNKYRSDNQVNESKTDWDGYFYNGISKSGEVGDEFSIIPPYYALAFIMYKGI